MRNANRTGSVTKMAGNRRRPYIVRISDGYVYDEDNDKYILKRKTLGYYESQAKARKALADYLDCPCELDLIDITFSEIWERVKPTLKVSKSRLDCYSSAFNYCKPIHNKKLRELKSDALQKIIDACPKKSGTKSDIKTVMRLIFEYGMKNDIVPKDYSDYVHFERDAVTIKRELFSSEAVSRLRTRSNEWPYALMLILLYTGMRISEFTENTKANVDMVNKVIKIEKAKNASSVRTVPIHNDIIPLIEMFLSHPGTDLCTKPNGTKFNYKNFMSRELKEICEYIGEEHTPHDTRHTFITKARECGLNNLVIQRIVGHAPDTITEKVYTHLTNEDLVESVNKVNF